MNFVLLDVAIGLATIFFLVALFCAGVQEVLAGYLNLRGKTLWEGIESLLCSVDDPDATIKGEAASDPGTMLAADVLAHPVVRGQVSDAFTLVDFFRWVRGSRRPKPPGVNKKPAYLQARTFADSLVDSIKNRYKVAGVVASTLKEAVEEMPAGPLQKTLQSFIAKCGADEQKTVQMIEQWFDEAMERVSGWYKRRTQFMLFLVGLLVSVLFNIDSIQIFTQLWKEPTVRALMVAQAQELVVTPEMKPKADVTATASSGSAAKADTNPNDQLRLGQMDIKQAQDRINALPPSLPMGWPPAWLSGHPQPVSWSEFFSRDFLSQHCWDIFLQIAGWLVTAAAACMGSPFWFELIGKLVPLRSAGSKPGEKRANLPSKPDVSGTGEDFEKKGQSVIAKV